MLPFLVRFLVFEITNEPHPSLNGLLTITYCCKNEFLSQDKNETLVDQKLLNIIFLLIFISFFSHLIRRFIYGLNIFSGELINPFFKNHVKSRPTFSKKIERFFQLSGILKIEKGLATENKMADRVTKLIYYKLN